MSQQQSNYIPCKRPPINWTATRKNLENRISTYNEKIQSEEDAKPVGHKQKGRKIKTGQSTTAYNLYFYLLRCYERGVLYQGKIRLTHSYLAKQVRNTHTARTTYNHIKKLSKKEIGLIKSKNSASANFGKGSVNCIEIQLDTSIVDFYDKNISNTLNMAGDNAVEKPESTRLEAANEADSKLRSD
jgi:hypothetical protein